MDDFDQQIASTDQQAQAVRRRLPARPVDSYTLLLVVGLIVSLVGMGYLVLYHFDYYGLPTSAKPVVGQVTAVSARGIVVDIGADDGLSAKDNLMILRGGVFLSDASVQTVQPDAATVSVQDETVEIIAGDTIVLSPLDAKR